MSNNIHPIFDRLLSREDKEGLLSQHGKVIWMLGLSGSGKSTLARLAEQELYKHGFHTQILDGDNLRVGLNANLGFSVEDRRENIRRAAEAAKLISGNGTVVIASFICPTNEIQAQVRDIIGEDLIMVYIKASVNACEDRDVKGLYAKARKGEIQNFTGIDSPFQAPVNPELTLDTENQSPEESLKELTEFIFPKISFS